MSGARLGNFPLQRIGVRGDSMRSGQPRGAVSVREAGWVLARIWKFGEFSGLDAQTPLSNGKSAHLEKRARKLVGKVLVIQRLGGASGIESDFIQIKRLIKVDRLENGSFGFWVEGDNTGASTDSRNWGYLRGMEIRGRVIFSRGIH